MTPLQNGSLDPPCERLLLGGRGLIVVGMGRPAPGTTNAVHDEPHTPSVIRRDDCR